MPHDSCIWQLEIALASAPTAGKRVLDEVLFQLERHAWHREDVFAVHLSLEEALVNAIRHGNGCDPDKFVRVDCRLWPDRFWIAIEDEGPGFRPEQVPDCTAPDRLHVPSGRGLLLIQSYMSHVVYNDKGNRVEMEKRRTQR